jgi:hypothetical protein
MTPWAVLHFPPPQITPEPPRDQWVAQRMTLTIQNRSGKGLTPLCEVVRRTLMRRPRATATYSPQCPSKQLTIDHAFLWALATLPPLGF